MTMKTIGFGTAHAKIILIGEHAVVYGHPGIAIPFLPLKVSVKVEPHQEDVLVSSFYQGSMQTIPAELIFISFLVDELRKKLSIPFIQVTIDNHIPTSAGMGSSAAISGAIVEAIYDLADQPLSQDIRFEHTQSAEKLVHGSASGIDALTTASQHAWYFVKGKPPEALTISLPAWLIVASSGIKGRTKEAVSQVANLFLKNQAQGHLESIGLMSLLMKEAIEKKEIDDVARLLNQTHFHLQELGVSHPTMDAWIEKALNLGALAGKMTGGGLGGSLIILTDQLTMAHTIKTYFQEHLTTDVWIMDLNV